MVRPLNALMVSSTKPELVQRVGMDHHLDVVIVGDRKTIVDRGRRRAPILVQLERAGAALHHFLQRGGQRRIALAGKAEIDRERIRRLDHARDMPRPRRAGGGEGAVRRTGAAAEQRGHARHQRVVHLLRTDEMDMRVEAAGGEDLALARDHLGARADDDGDARLDIRIAGLADRMHLAVLQSDIGLHDAPVIEHQRIGDDGVDRALPVGHLRLAHAVADHLAAAEFHLLAIDGEILLHLDDDVGIGEPHPVAGGGAEHLGIEIAGDFGRHGPAPGGLGHGRARAGQKMMLVRASGDQFGRRVASRPSLPPLCTVCARKVAQSVRVVLDGLLRHPRLQVDLDSWSLACIVEAPRAIRRNFRLQRQFRGVDDLLQVVDRADQLVDPLGRPAILPQADCRSSVRERGPRPAAGSRLFGPSADRD